MIIKFKLSISTLKAIDSLYRNQKGFLLSPLYKHLKGIFASTRNENWKRALIDKNQQRLASYLGSKQFLYKKTNLFKE